jgi:hypothetical protein
MPCKDRGFSGFAGANFVRERNPADLPKAAFHWRIEWL